MPTKLLFIGATGYIGGSVLAQLRDSTNPNISSSQISALIRGEAKAQAFEDTGITPILFNDLDELDIVEKAASDHDVIINTASSLHTSAAVAFIRGLAKRKALQGGEPCYIHTSGTSNLSDQSITGLYRETREFYDNDDVYSYLIHREEEVQYPQRTTDIAVVQAGKQLGIKTYIIMPPTVYGVSNAKLGNPNPLSVQVPHLILAALQTGHAVYIGEGKGVCDHVHADDLASAYEIVLTSILNGTQLPHGEKGIFFTSAGRHTWKQIAQGIADAGYKLGALKTSQAESLGLEEAAKKLTAGNAFMAEVGYAANARTNSVLLKGLGWSPKKTDEDFGRHFEQEFDLIYNGKGDILSRLQANNSSRLAIVSHSS